MSEVADSTEARSQSLNPHYLLSTATQTIIIKKRRTVADSVTSVGESGDLDPCLGASVASLGATLQMAEKRVSLSFEVPDHHHSIIDPTALYTS